MANVVTGKGAAQFDFRVDPPLKEFQFELSRFSEGLTDFTEMFQRIGPVFKKQMRGQFQSEGSLGTGRWQALSDNPTGAGYKSWKAKKYPGAKIGHLTGALEKSMTGGAGYSQVIGQKSASFGMDAGSKAAAYGHYFSAVRPVIVPNTLRGREMQKSVTAWVREQAHHAGLIGKGSTTFNQPLLDNTATLPST